MYGLQLDAAHAGFVMELKGLGVPALVVNVDDGGSLSLGLPRNVSEGSIIHCASACGEVRLSSGWSSRLCLRVRGLGCRTKTSSHGGMRGGWKRSMFAQGSVAQLE